MSERLRSQTTQVKNQYKVDFPLSHLDASTTQGGTSPNSRPTS